MKPGWATTEFYVTLLTHLGALVALIHPGFDVSPWAQPLAMIAAALAAAAYSRSRSRVKQAAMFGDKLSGWSAVVEGKSASPASGTSSL